VLLLSDRVDEWVMSYLTEFDGKQLVSVTKGELDLGKLEDEAEKEGAGSRKPVSTRIWPSASRRRSASGQGSARDAPPDRFAGLPGGRRARHEHANLQRMLKAAGQRRRLAKPILEVNPQHAIVQRLKAEADEARFDDWSRVLFDQALLAEGGQLEDPASFVKRVNQLMLAMAGEASRIILPG
jgi:molecular chaperone HtpG